MKFIGDTRLMEQLGLHNIPVNTERKAQNLVDDLMEFVGWDYEKVNVFYEHKDNKRRMAIFTRAWGKPEIRVKAIRAREVGTLIHELAHHRYSGHGRMYKVTQQLLIDAYLKMTDPNIKDEDVWVWNERSK